LIADDEAVSRLRLEKSLEGWGYQVLAVSDGNQAWEILRHPDAPRLAILDWMMPTKDGVEDCRKIREQKDSRYRFVVLLTGREEKEDVADGLDAGADDYLTKPFDALELRARLRAGMRILALEEELIRVNDRLKYEASHDSLTGLWNRAAIMQLFGRELSRMPGKRGSVAVIMADVDRFKQINDTRGHAAGDAVLKEVAARMRSSLRDDDSVGRYGGEEFLIVISGTSRNDAVVQAERLRSAIAREPVLTPEGLIEVTMSFGVSLARAETGMEQLLQAADKALYRSKERGRNLVEYGD
jgi:diguanylate cyclase (GGDEF)-like protein